MSENVTLDRIDFEKLKEQAKAERAECLHQYGTAALEVVGSAVTRTSCHRYRSNAHHFVRSEDVFLVGSNC